METIIEVRFVVFVPFLQRVLLFLARFSHVIGGTKICDGCGTDLVKGTRQFFCLTCLKVILCNSCHESECL